MAGELEFFKRFLYEAPGNDPPPDMPEQDQEGNDSIDASDPPDIPDDTDDVGDAPPDSIDAPPDLDDPGGDMGDMNEDDYSDITGIDTSEQPSDEGLDEKISTIMNQHLYNRYLQLIGKIVSQLSQMKDNNDILYATSQDCSEVIEKLTKLEESLRLYMNHQFTSKPYGKNLQFFNKCLNYWALLNMIFDGIMKKGAKKLDDA